METKGCMVFMGIISVICGAEMGGNGEAAGAGLDDGDVGSVHR